MKSIRFITIIAALVTCISCSKEENDPEVDSNMVLGEWNLEEMSYSGTSSLTSEGQTSSLTYTAEAIDINAQVTFNDENNYSTSGSYTIRMSTTMEGQTTVQDNPFTNVNVTGTYRIEGNKILTIPNLPAGSEQEYLMTSGEGVIMELTANKMVIFATEEVTSTTGNMTLEVTYELIQILTR